MYRIDVRDLAKLERRLRLHLTFLPFFRALNIKPAQTALYFRYGVDNGRLLKQSTIKARLRRWGYYRQKKATRVASAKPYMVWTRNTMEHTYAADDGKGRKSTRVGYLTISHGLVRRVKDFWDEKRLDRYVERAAEDYFQKVLDGERVPRTITARSAA